jgi:hypothetical protein
MTHLTDHAHPANGCKLQSRHIQLYPGSLAIEPGTPNLPTELLHYILLVDDDQAQWPRHSIKRTRVRSDPKRLARHGACWLLRQFALGQSHLVANQRGQLFRRSADQFTDRRLARR